MKRSTATTTYSNRSLSLSVTDFYFRPVKTLLKLHENVNKHQFKSHKKKYFESIYTSYCRLKNSVYKMVSIKSEIFNLDNSTQLEFLEPPKTLVVIDKVIFSKFRILL